MKLVYCWIEHPIRSIDQLFTYSCDYDIEPLTRVEVDFNGRNVIGFVERVEETEETQEEVEKRISATLKPIQNVLDESSLLSDELHDLASYMRDTTVSTMISCFQTMLPGKVKPHTSKHKIIQETFVALCDNEVSLTPKQLDAFIWLKGQPEITYSAFRKKYPNVARPLIEKGAIRLYQKEKTSKEFVVKGSSKKFELTNEQAHAMEEIEKSNDSVYLLKGVTGSGKTEVYLQLAEKALMNGKQVLILVPEISLTPQMIQRVSSRFGGSLAIYHSGLNPQEKYEQFRKVQRGDASVVVGTRSAVFLPFSALGLIIMDEEHDSSYKQDKQPAYHCRDIAVWRGNYHQCKVILGSATPSLESYARALKHVYHLVSLNERVNQTLPEVTIVPMKEAMKAGQSYILSDVLKNKLKERLNNKQQAILLLNRRGYHSQLRCRSCQEVISCPHCELAMSYHYQDKMMKCHTCGTMIHVPKVCPSCGSKSGFSSYGFGTEKLQEEIKNVFPEARVLRMDADTTSRKNMHEKILTAFGRKEADILVGTQMIAKGLDYPDVTLVGVINGDDGLARTDFRSCEVTFDLLMQAGGRSGRSGKSGEIVFQVYDPQNYAVQAAAKQNYEAFFMKEMQFRHAGMYPPYTFMIALTVYGKNEVKVNETASWIRENAKGNFKTIGVISLLKIKDQYRSRIVLKGKDLEEMRCVCREILSHENSRGKDIRVDVNPMVLD